VRRPFSALLLLFLVLGLDAFAQEPQVRAFRLRFHSLSEATALLAPMLSAQGSLMLQPAAETVVVRDRADVLAHVAATIHAWDVQPAEFAIDLRLLKASALPRRGAVGPPIDQDVVAGLKHLFGFKAFDLIDSLTIQVAAGTPVETVAGAQYVLHFVPRWSPEGEGRIVLAAFELGYRAALPSGIEAVRPVMRRGTVSVRFGQTSVIGIARSEDANEALVMVLKVRKAEGK
jgi:hypothetical protein